MAEFHPSPAYLRLSVTDACNFRCLYCRPSDAALSAPRNRPLSVDEIGNLVAAMTSIGVGKVRITGGEPGLRPDLPAILGRVSGTPGIGSVGLTTNGTALQGPQGSSARLAELVSAGLSRLNVSLDSLHPEVFSRITGSNALPGILVAIDAACQMPGLTVKLNVVVMKGINAADLECWLDFVRARPVTVRFIELMETRGSREILPARFVPLSPLLAQLTHAGWLPCDRDALAGPAQELRHPEHAGRIGVILPVTHPFCSACNRLRVTSNGHLHLCAFRDQASPLRHLLQSPLQRHELTAILRDLTGRKKMEGMQGQGPLVRAQDFSSLGG